MSDMIDLVESPEPDTNLRDEIRQISDRVRRRRQLRSKFMITLCALALSVTAVPLFLLLYQLFDRGLPVILHTGFFTQLPQTPNLITRMPLVGSRMPSSVLSCCRSTRRSWRSPSGSS